MMRWTVVHLVQPGIWACFSCFFSPEMAAFSWLVQFQQARHDNVTWPSAVYTYVWRVTCSPTAETDCLLDPHLLYCHRRRCLQAACCTAMPRFHHRVSNAQFTPPAITTRRSCLCRVWRGGVN